jgi:hypothetical protein
MQCHYNKLFHIHNQPVNARISTHPPCLVLFCQHKIPTEVTNLYIDVTNDVMLDHVSWFPQNVCHETLKTTRTNYAFLARPTYQVLVRRAKRYFRNSVVELAQAGKVILELLVFKRLHELHRNRDVV